MYARAAYSLREGVKPQAELSFVAIRDGAIIGSVRQTLIQVGKKPAVLLGPLGVLAIHNSNGVGKALMRTAIRAAREKSGDYGSEIILLVGDLAYYHRFGFERVADGKIVMPRPVAPGRILALELCEGALEHITGVAGLLYR